jgi:hypothetical protein
LEQMMRSRFLEHPSSGRFAATFSHNKGRRESARSIRRAK